MEDFVPFEIAQKLKEKGFRELCTHFYRNGTSTPQEMFCGLRSNTHHKWSFNSMEVKLKDTHERVQVNIVDAPTISQVLKWLRKEKRIDAGAVWDNMDSKWIGYVNEMDMPDLVGGYVLPNTYDLYELAALAGIEYTLNKVI